MKNALALVLIATDVKEDQANAMLHVLGTDGHRAMMHKLPFAVIEDDLIIRKWKVQAYLPEHKAKNIIKAVRESCLVLSPAS